MEVGEGVRSFYNNNPVSVIFLLGFLFLTKGDNV